MNIANESNRSITEKTDLMLLALRLRMKTLNAVEADDGEGVALNDLFVEALEHTSYYRNRVDQSVVDGVMARLMPLREVEITGIEDGGQIKVLVHKHGGDKRGPHRCRP